MKSLVLPIQLRPSPPKHRALVIPGLKKRTGRPPVWNGLLAKFKAVEAATGRGKAKKGPYKNEETAVAAAGYFNAQMRVNDYESYRTGYRFRGRKGNVVVKHYEVER